jgi:hypothetical protein
MGVANDLLKLFRREGGTSKLEIVEFAPVAMETTEVTTVRMLASVGGKFPDHTKEKPHRWNLEGGKEYEVSRPLADEFIINGWAVGTLSRKYSTDEINEIRSRTQNIQMGALNG